MRGGVSVKELMVALFLAGIIGLSTVVLIVRAIEYFKEERYYRFAICLLALFYMAKMLF